MQTPTVGRQLHFYPGDDMKSLGDGPWACTVSAMHSDQCVNVGAVLLPEGRILEAPPTSVCVVAEDESPPTTGEPYCKWPPRT